MIEGIRPYALYHSSLGALARADRSEKARLSAEDVGVVTCAAGDGIYDVCTCVSSILKSVVSRNWRMTI